MLFAQVTDIHIGFEPDNPAEMNTRRFESILAEFMELKPRPDFLLCTGDLTETGSVQHYRALKEMLDSLPFPYHCTAGNHDKRDAFLEVFSDTPTHDGYLQYSFMAGDLEIIVLDTSDPHRHGGVFGPDRAAWLSDTLAKRSGPVVIAMHHPPAPSGVPWITAHEYEPWVHRLRDTIAGHAERVMGILAGHYHRPMTATWAKAGVFVCPSAAPRVGLDLRPIDPARPADFRPLIVEEPPSFGLHLWNGETLVSHAVSVGDWPVLARINEGVGRMVTRLIAERASGAPEPAAAEVSRAAA
ncbi:MAG: metallophosphoesterase [Sphingomonadaceae bacterium]|nr:metallophosphoesterase [Sphingomonadaceae bacterium]